MMKLLIATSNPHKLDEIRAIIADKSFELVSLADLPQQFEEPAEDGATFEDNAVLKARYYAKASGMLCLADDSGLEVDALGGEPGVRSARYSETDGPRAERDAANCRLLLEQLADTPIERRTARFVCAMALVDGREPSDEPLAVVRGTLEGRILMLDEAADPAHPERGRGTNGFGYDPIVFVPQLNKTVAELTSDEKNVISHRRWAATKIHPRLYSWHFFRNQDRNVSVSKKLIQEFLDAAIADRPKALKILGEYPKIRDTNVTLGETPLHYMAVEAQVQAIEFLAGEGFEVDSRNMFGDTPLMDAANMGELETAEVLLRLGADPNAESGECDYALFRAIKSENPNMVKLLLDHGASVSHRNCYGESVMDVVQEIDNYRLEIEQLLQKAMGKKSSD